MIWVLVVVQWLHVFFAIFWFGAVLTIDFLVIPTALSLPAQVQQTFGGAFGQRAPKVVLPVAIIAIVLGIIRGVTGGVLGNIGSAYGLTWTASLVLGIGLACWGYFLIAPTADRLQKIAPGAKFDAAIARIRVLTISELFGFAVILTFMIAMRFGF
ncbi:MAG TPA: hypothetical protein VIO37_06210 [Candidatus Dormibacteraeota bacterium]